MYDPIKDRLPERSFESIHATGVPRLKINSILPPGMTSSRFLKKLLCDFRIQKHSTNGSSGGEGGNSI